MPQRPPPAAPSVWDEIDRELSPRPPAPMATSVWDEIDRELTSAPTPTPRPAPARKPGDYAGFFDMRPSGATLPQPTDAQLLRRPPPVVGRGYTDPASARVTPSVATPSAPLPPPPGEPLLRSRTGQLYRPPPVGDASRITDLGISALKGAIGLPEAAVGAVDVALAGPAAGFVPGGMVGRAAEAVGFQPKLAKAILDTYYSDPQKAANRALQQADGPLEVAIAALSNPSTIVQTVVESAPLMLGGAGIARGAMGAGMRAVGAAALGEGTVAGGSAAETIRQQTPGGTLSAGQAALAAGSGAATGLLGAFGGKLAQRLGIVDVDTMLAAAATDATARRGLVHQIVVGAAQEGFLEELPQSVQEQVAQNAALGKPLDEGVDHAAIIGTLAGVVMGAAPAVVPRAATLPPPITSTQVPSRDQAPPPINAPPVAEQPGAAAAVAPVIPEPALSPDAPAAVPDPAAVWQAVEQEVASVPAELPDPDLERRPAPWPVDDSGRALGGFAGPERRSSERVPSEDEDRVYAEYRERVARGEDVVSPAARKTLKQRQSLDTAREQAAIDEVRQAEPKPDVWKEVEAEMKPEDVWQVIDALDTGEAQPRLPGAAEARQVGKADTTFKAPQQARGDDFALAPVETADANARREAEQQPSLVEQPEPVPAPADTPPSHQPVPEQFADLSPVERREVRRIAKELESYQYESTTRTIDPDLPRGKDEAWVAGHGGAPVFHDIMDGRAGQRSAVQNAITRYMAGKKPSSLAKRAVEIARRRAAGDLHLSKPILPPDAGDEPGGIYVDRRRELPPAEARVQDAFADAIERDPAGFVRQYRERFGKVVNADLAKELSSEYSASNASRAEFARAVQPPSSRLARGVYRTMLDETRGQRGFVLFTAGGTGSGKTSSLDLFPPLKEDAEIIYDSTLASKQGAGADIAAALSAGKEVGIVFTYRDVEQAFRGVLERATTEGRTVTVGAHARTHARAADVARDLMAQYRDEDRVLFVFVENSGESLESERHIVGPDVLDRARYNVDNVEARLRTILDAEHAAGRVSDAIYHATLGTQRQPEQGSRPAVQGESGAVGERSERGDRETGGDRSTGGTLSEVIPSRHPAKGSLPVAPRRVAAPTAPGTGLPVRPRRDSKGTLSESLRSPTRRDMSDLRARGFDTSRVYYHQTSAANAAAISVEGFDLAKGRARLSDEQLPDGVFFKPHDRDIGVGASGDEAAQIPVYLRFGETRHFKERAGLESYLSRDKQYADLVRDARIYDREQSERFDQAEAQLRELDARGRHQHAGNKRQVGIDALLEEWEAGGVARASAARARATEVLRAEGVETVVIQEDTGSFGRKTETVIVLAGHQVAAADPDNRILFETLGSPTRRAFFEPPKSRLPVRAKDDVVRPSDIVKRVTALFNQLPVKTGRFKERAHGMYKPDLQVIRLRVENDLATLAHELGHHVDKAIFGADLPYGLYADELLALGTNTSRASDSKQRKLKEGAAEFFRLYVGDPSEAKRQAPTYYQAFDEALDVNAWAPAIREVQQTVQEYLAQDLATRGAARIDFTGNDGPPSLFRQIARDPKDFLHRMERAWVEDLAEAERVVAALEADSGEAIDYHESGYVLGRLARGAAGKAQGFLHHGVRAADGTFLSGSLEQILKPVAERLAEFSRFLVALRVVELRGRGIETGISVAEAQAILDKAVQPGYMAALRALDATRAGDDTGLTEEKAEAAVKAQIRDGYEVFDQARAGLYGYQDAVLRYAREHGALSGDQVRAMKAVNRFYVPFQRVLDSAQESLTGTSRSLANRGLPVKRIKGSGKDIINPLESIIRNTFAIVDMVEKNRAMLALVDQASDVKGSARFIERIPEPQVGTRFNLAQVGGAIREALEDAGLDLAEVLPDGGALELDEMVTVFTPATFAARGANIVSVIRHGKREWFSVNDQALYDTITAVGPKIAGWVQALSGPASWLRAGATLTLGFIARNPARDTFVAGVQSRYGFVPVVDTVRGLYSYLRADEYYQDFLNSGAANAALVSRDRNQVRNELRKMVDRKAIPRNPIEILRALSEATENATRLGEFRKAVKKEGRSTEGLARAALAARDVTLDFARAGTVGRQVNQFAAFFNARVQGYARMAELARSDYGRLRHGDANPMHYATGRAAVYVALVSAIVWALNADDEEYEEIPAWEKATYWHVPLGEDKGWARIPKPFEWGAIFGTTTEAALDFLKTKDPAKLRNLFPDGPGPSLRSALLTILPVAIMPWIEVWSNHSFFRDQNIVSPYDVDLPPELQYSRWTSGTAKVLGNAIGVSPAKIDHLVNGYFAGMGRAAMHAPDVFAQIGGASKAPAWTAADIPIVGTFYRRRAFAGQAESLQDLYDAAEQLRGAARGIRIHKERGDTAAANRIARSIGPIAGRKAAIDEAVRELRELRPGIDAIYVSTKLSADAKRQALDRTYEKMVSIARRALGRPPMRAAPREATR